MRITFRWYGEGNDNVTLDQIRQIPGVEGVAWALHDIPTGEDWPMNRILKVKEQVEAKGLNIEVVEGLLVHEDIKLGLPTRDKYIENFNKTLEKLAEAGVKIACYNFMPVLDWTRTSLYTELDDGSTATSFENSMVDNIDPQVLAKKIGENTNLTMPGWEEGKLEEISNLINLYKRKNVTEEDLWDNFKYFLESVIPVAEANDIKIAVHPDDPPWSIFGLPRIITNHKNVRKLLKLVDNPYNTIALCSGALGSNLENNVPDMIREFSDRIPFAHIRNVKVYDNGDFVETSHRTCDGSIDVYDVVKAYHENNYNGYVRPDHGRHIWNEKGRAAYGLYDRALGVMYLLGIWDALERKK